MSLASDMMDAFATPLVRGVRVEKGHDAGDMTLGILCTVVPRESRRPPQRPPDNLECWKDLDGLRAEMTCRKRLLPRPIAEGQRSILTPPLARLRDLLIAVWELLSLLGIRRCQEFIKRMMTDHFVSPCP